MPPPAEFESPRHETSEEAERARIENPRLSPEIYLEIGEATTGRLPRREGEPAPNNDDVITRDHKDRYFAMFDGAFGGGNGLEAAQLAAQGLKAEFEFETPSTTLDEEIQRLNTYMEETDTALQRLSASREVPQTQDEFDEAPSTVRLGTTALIAEPWYDEATGRQQLILSHIGDTRALMLKQTDEENRSLEHLTIDDNSLKINGDLSEKFRGEVQKIISSMKNADDPIPEDVIARLTKECPSDVAMVARPDRVFNKNLPTESTLRGFISETYEGFMFSAEQLGTKRGALNAVFEAAEAADPIKAEAARKLDVTSVFTPNTKVVNFDTGNTLLIVSDGITDNLSDPEMLVAIGDETAPDKISQLLVDAAAKKRPAPKPRIPQPRDENEPEANGVNDDISVLAVGARHKKAAQAAIPGQPRPL